MLNSVIPVVLAAVAPVLMFHRVYWSSQGNEAYFYGDTTGSYWPDLIYFVRTLAHWEFPIWNPNERGGIPFAFDPQPGVLYPLNWCLAAIGLALGHTPFSLFEFKILIHLSLATVGWYLWARSRFSPAASLVGAVSGGLGLYTIQNTHFGLIWPITWVPWALLFLDRCLNTRRKGFAVAFAACIGCMFSAGSPPGTLYGALVVAGLGLPQVLRTLIRAESNVRRRLLLLGLIGVTVACVLSFPVLLGTNLLTQCSVLEKRDYAFFASAPLWLSNLTSLIIPATHGLSMYAGATVVTLAAVGLLRKAWSLLSISAIAVGAFGLVMALGDQTPVAAWVYSHFPPVRYFRLIFRYLYLLQAALAVLATIGAEELLSLRKRGLWALGLLTLLALVVTLLVVQSGSGHSQLPREVSSKLIDVRNWVLVILAAAWLSWGIRQRLIRYIALPGVLLADFTLVVPTANTLRDGIFSVPDQVTSGQLRQVLDESPLYRVWDEFALGYRSGSRIGVRDLRGYMDPLRLAHYETMAAHLWNAPLQLQRWNVRWVLPAPLPSLGSSHNRVNIHKLTFAKRLEPHVIELPRPRPVAVFTNRIAVPATEEQLWAVLDQDPMGAPVQLPPLNQWNYSERELQSIRTPVLPSADVPATLLARGSNSLSLSVQAPSDGWLVVNEAYFPGWVADVDGVAAPVYRVDGWVRGLRIPKGSHRVYLAFRPHTWLVVAGAAVAVWFGILVYGALALRRELGGTERVRRTRVPSQDISSIHRSTV